MKANSLEQKFSAEVIGVFPFPGLDNFIVSVKTRWYECQTIANGLATQYTTRV